MHNIQAEIFVVDNNSTDESNLFFKEKFNGVKFIWNKTNLGFAKANNAALPFAKGKYILFLNPDTIVAEDCFIKCITFFDSQVDAGALGVHMIDGSGKFLKESKRAFPSPLTSLFKLSGLTKMFPRSKLFARYYLGSLNENENTEVDVLAGAFMMIPKKIIDSLSGFDESFFMYGEDIDLSFRIQKLGYKNLYFAETTIVHFKGESSKKDSLNYVKVFYSAMSIFVKKHYGGRKAKFFSFFIQGGIFVRALLSAMSRFIRLNGMPATYVRGLNSIDEDDELKKTIIAGTIDEFKRVLEIMQQAGIEGRILGRIDVDDKSEISSLCNVEQLQHWLTSHPTKEVIICEGKLSFKRIIELVKIIAPDIRIKFYASCSETIIGSDSENDTGRYVTKQLSI
jgi:GT2 family glycosyltransferase